MKRGIKFKVLERNDVNYSKGLTSDQTVQFLSGVHPLIPLFKKRFKFLVLIVDSWIKANRNCGMDFR